MKLKGFNQNDYVNELLEYCRSYIPDWLNKTSADILAIAEEFNIDFEDHYMTDGWKFGFSPNRYFNPVEYKSAWQTKHPGDTLEGIDLYKHYIEVGAAQDINPSNSFDESDYINNVLNYYKQQSPAEWAEITYNSLKEVMASAQITALTFHTDYNIDESIFPVFNVPPGEAVTPVEIPDIITVIIDTTQNSMTYNALDANVRFDFIQGNYQYNIYGFGPGDVLNVLDSASITVLNRYGDDGIIDISVSDAATLATLEIHLTGIATAQDGAIFNLSSLNNAFGAGSLG